MKAALCLWLWLTARLCFQRGYFFKQQKLMRNANILQHRQSFKKKVWPPSHGLILMGLWNGCLQWHPGWATAGGSIDPQGLNGAPCTPLDLLAPFSSLFLSHNLTKFWIDPVHGGNVPWPCLFWQVLKQLYASLLCSLEEGRQGPGDWDPFKEWGTFCACQSDADVCVGPWEAVSPLWFLWGIWISLGSI